MSSYLALCDDPKNDNDNNDHDPVQRLDVSPGLPAPDPGVSAASPPGPDPGQTQQPEPDHVRRERPHTEGEI